MAIFGEAVRTAGTRARYVRSVHHEKLSIDDFRGMRFRVAVVVAGVLLPERPDRLLPEQALRMVGVILAAATITIAFYHSCAVCRARLPPAGAHRAVRQALGPADRRVVVRGDEHRDLALVAAVREQLLEARVVVALRAHPPALLALDGDVAQEAVRHHARVELEQPVLAAHARQVEAVDLAQHDVQHVRADVRGAVQAEGHRVGAAGRNDADRHRNRRHRLDRLVRINF